MKALSLALILVMAPAAQAATMMEPAVQARLGITVQPVRAGSNRGYINGYARVLDPVPLASLYSEMMSAAAALQASQAEALRTRDLAAAGATVSRRVAESASAQARADQLRLSLLHQRVALEWGPGLGALGDERLGKLIGDLVAGRAALVRLDIPGGIGPVNQAYIDLGGGRQVGVKSLGLARAGDARLQSGGVLGVVTGPAALTLASGLTFPARMTQATGKSGQGVLVPRAAILRAGGESAVYVQLDPSHFQRRALQGLSPHPGGMFVAGGVQPGDRVVVTGASALFAVDQGARDEDD